MKSVEGKIWVNVTTIYNWNRPAVGIIRVESEFVRYLLDSGANDHYFVYDSNNNTYIEVSKESVRASLRRQAKAFKSPESEKSKQTKNIKSKIKNIIKRIHLRLPNPTNTIFWNLYGISRKIYRNIFLIPRYYLRQYINTTIKPFLSGLTSRSVKTKGEPAQFHENDWVISMGLNWDYLHGDRLGEFDIKRKYGAKIAFVCYDLIPIKLPHLCVFEVANKFSKYFADVAWIADHIFCISNNSMRDLQDYLKEVGAPMPSMSVIRLGDNLPKKSEKKSNISVKTRLVVENSPYLLYVSTIERRKNHEVLYRAYRRLLEQDISNLPQLVFVGMPGWGVDDFLQDLINDPLVKNRITILSHVNDDELDLLIKNCLFTVYPSLYEGWGLPVAESLSYGKFALISNNASLPEVGGNLVEYLDPWDVNAWANRIRYYTNNYLALKEKESNILNIYKPNSWKEMTSQILDKLLQESD